MNRPAPAWRASNAGEGQWILQTTGITDQVSYVVEHHSEQLLKPYWVRKLDTDQVEARLPSLMDALDWVLRHGSPGQNLDLVS